MIGLQRQGRRGLPHLDILTGLLSMVLVLVTFFLAHMNFTVRAGVDLLRADAATQNNRADAIVVRVSSAGTVHLRAKRLELTELRRAVENARFEAPRAPVVVMSEDGASAAFVLRVVDQCRLAGATDLRFTLPRE